MTLQDLKGFARFLCEADPRECPVGQKSYKSEQINKRKMNLIQEYNKRYEFFRDITGEAMRVHRKFHGGLLESAYEAALKYTVERQKFLPIYWDDVRLDQDYRMDLVVNGNIIIELKAINHIDTPHRRQLWNYMNLTHLPYGMLINFSPDGLYSEWYYRNESTGNIDKIKLL